MEFPAPQSGEAYEVHGSDCVLGLYPLYDRHLARIIHDGSWQNRAERVPREAYLLCCMRRHRHTHFALRFTLHASRTTSDEERRSSGSAIATEVFMNNAGQVVSS